MAPSNIQGKRFSVKVPDIGTPTQLPNDPEQAIRWQEANKEWWEHNPMRYDWRDKIAASPGTVEYFDEIDKRFFWSVKHYMPWKERPFDNLIDFESLSDKDVLEIGVGHGSHAELIAPHCKHFVGIDLTETAVNMTRRRLEQKDIPAEVLKMDAEKMSFPDANFDFIWTWGVIHHSSNTLHILKEIRRVLRPGGTAVVMVYHRSPWAYYVMGGFLRGVICGELFRQGATVHRVNQAHTDGAIARSYTVSEWTELCSRVLPVTSVAVVGQKTDVIPLPAGGLKNAVSGWFPDPIARFLTNKFRCGNFLISQHTF